MKTEKVEEEDHFIERKINKYQPPNITVDVTY